MKAPTIETSLFIAYLEGCFSGEQPLSDETLSSYDKDLENLLININVSKDVRDELSDIMNDSGTARSESAFAAGIRLGIQLGTLYPVTGECRELMNRLISALEKGEVK